MPILLSMGSSWMKTRNSSESKGFSKSPEKLNSSLICRSFDYLLQCTYGVYSFTFVNVSYPSQTSLLNSLSMCRCTCRCCSLVTHIALYWVHVVKFLGFLASLILKLSMLYREEQRLMSKLFHHDMFLWRKLYLPINWVQCVWLPFVCTFQLSDKMINFYYFN